MSQLVQNVFTWTLAMLMLITRIYVIVVIRCLDLDTCNGDVNDDPFNYENSFESEDKSEKNEKKEKTYENWFGQYSI